MRKEKIFFKIIPGSVTAPAGFIAGGINCGMRKRREDLGAIFSKEPCRVACVFTRNSVKAAPVLLSQKHAKSRRVNGIIVNSVNANCCTGSRGLRDAERMAFMTARALKVDKERILVASTGVIGKRLAIDLIGRGIPGLVQSLSRKNEKHFRRSILTTDLTEKHLALSWRSDGVTVRMGGAAKGSGMIHPDMATMLAFITTDLAISDRLLKKALTEVVADTFNKISVDGDMSTNDSVYLFANGSAGNKPIKSEGPAYRRFCQCLGFLSADLAGKIVLDGEGATKFMTIKVAGAKTRRDAGLIARHVARSNLLKTAVFGENPNWGRIAASAGSAGVVFDQKKMDIYIGRVKVVLKGSRAGASPALLKKIFKKKNIDITIDLNSGKGYSEVKTCDLSHEYIRINTAYS